MKIELAKDSQCCGCGICASVCPAQAIEMVPKELGCLYPQIDTEKCIQCHACEKACAVLQGSGKAPAVQTVYAAAAKNTSVLKGSASGGVFAAVAHEVIDAGGIVYGCSLEMRNGILTPMHIGVTDHEAVKKLQGSKYVQSTLGNTFAEIRDHLQNKRLVLFSGTPCQVDALKHYLRNTDTSGLFTMDLICHGVPSSMLFEDYLRILAAKSRGQISSFSFRDKTHGWGLNACYDIADHKRYLSSGISSYYTYFLRSEIYRESCYVCPHANENRAGDVTIGDFWGIEQEHPELLSENGGTLRMHDGVSTVLVNTPKGKELLERYGSGLALYKSELQKAQKWNRQLQMPSTYSNVRQELIQSYQKDGYRGIECIFRKELGIRYPVRRIKQLVRNRKIRTCERNTTE